MFKEFLVAKFQWQNNSRSKVYLCYRWLVAFFAVFSVIYNIYSNYERGLLAYYWIYQTHLNLILSAVTMIHGAILVTRFHMNNSKSAMACEIFDLLWHHSMCWAFCISGVYWIELYRNIPVTLSNILAHGTNSLIFAVDLYVVRCSPRLRTFGFTFIYTTIYLFFTFVYIELGGVNK